MPDIPDFVHLHNHTDYSLLDGAVSIKKMVSRAKELGMKHLAITDHGNMFGALKFYKECKAQEINPVIGCEFYVTPTSRKIKSGSDGGNRYNHLILLARNTQGYKNLMILSSLAYTEGFYYKPRIDNELLEKYHEGLICTSACIAGLIPKKILEGKTEEALKAAVYYNNLFGEGNFYLELQDHGIPEQKTVNEKLILISRRTGIPLIAANDIHYLTKEDANAQDILICIGTNSKKHEKKRMKFHSNEFYMKSKAEMYEVFNDVPEALSNTVKLAEKCNITIDLPGPQLPDYKIPSQFRSPDDYLRSLTMGGLSERYPKITKEIEERVKYELDVIIGMGFTGYFLIVWDFIHFARENDIPVGPGRGSGAGSIVAFALKITDIDPLKYDLLFERFLNPERVSMPDFDIDFCFERRQEVIDYVTRKYGVERVGQIITFGTLKAKAVIRDVARVLDIPYSEADQISKLVPSELKITLESALEKEPKLKEYEEKGEIYRELIDTGKRLEGLSRHASTHAAGVVIGKSALTDYVPLYRDAKTGSISTQYTMDQLEECGLVKMDFLGLKTLTLIKNTENLIRKKGIEFDSNTIPENDKKTFKLLGEGKSICVFQFESSGMQGILRQAKPGSIEDLIALNALYRPGPMQFIPQFIDSKSGKKPITYPDPSLEEVLKPTYGVIVYQEQVMKVAQIIGGFSLGKADVLRRAMGKKKVKDMELMKIEFIKGARKKGHSEKHASEIFEMLKPFAGYGFNKSHAAAYSVIAYKTAYLKANFPSEFMAANLTNEINSPDKLTNYINETKNMKIKILPPDINISDKKFTVEKGDIVYGLVGIKNIGEAAVDEIIRSRKEKGAYESFLDFLYKVDLRTVNKKGIESLIKCGAFDSFGDGRATLLHNLETMMEYTSKKKEGEMFGQTSLFDDNDTTQVPQLRMETVEEWPQMDKLKNEKELLGYYFSGHPMDKYKKIWKRSVNLDLGNLERARGEKKYTILGSINNIRTLITQKGKPMAFVQIEDFNGSIEMVLFPKTWETKGISMVHKDEIMGFTGKLDFSRETPQFLVDDVVSPENLKKTKTSEVHIRINRNICKEEDLVSFREYLMDFGGPCSVFLHIEDNDGNDSAVVKASSQITIDSSNSALNSIKEYPNIADVWTA